MTRRISFTVAGAVALAFLGAAGLRTLAQGEGYTDTPLLPGGKWRVHDKNRPNPPIITPGAALGQPPSDATVLFGGAEADLKKNWQGGSWKVENGMMVAGGGNIQTKENFEDFQLHIEFATPSEVKGSSQGRGNSGVFLQGRYEIQVLDSYDNKTYADGQVSAVYGQTPPQANVAKKPGEWQTYDIVFTAPRFDNDKLASPAYVTVLHNGVLTQNHTEILGATAHRNLPSYTAYTGGPIALQDHGNPTRFRNIWIRPIKESE